MDARLSPGAFRLYPPRGVLVAQAGEAAQRVRSRPSKYAAPVLERAPPEEMNVHLRSGPMAPSRALRRSDDRGHRLWAGGAAARRIMAVAAPAPAPALPDIAPDPRVAAAIALAIELATRRTAVALAYRVDGAAVDGRPSAWRAAMAPGSARLGVRPSDRR